MVDSSIWFNVYVSVWDLCSRGRSGHKSTGIWSGFRENILELN
jgi:hypothetical protein